VTGQKTELEILGRRIEGWPATVVLLGIWFVPFFAGIVVGAALFRS
jgi:hypothetical protein